VRTQYLGIKDLPKDFEDQMKALDKSLSSKQWNKKVVGGAMVLNVQVNFLKGEGPDGKKWKSTADETQFGGKFAKSYKYRSDKTKVTASSLRLSDTEKFRESYDVLWASKSNVEVGPVNTRGETFDNRQIAKVAETKWKNHIVGWGKRGKQIMDHIVSRALDYVMMGKTPPKVGYITSAGKLRGMF